MLVAILSLLQFLEDGGFIYVLYPPDSNEALFVCDGVESRNVAINQHGKSYTYTNGSKIEKKDGIWSVGGEKMYCMMLPKQLGKRIVHFFSANIYPTPALIELKDNKYKTVERRRFEKELRYARGSFFMAFIALIATLFVPFVNISYTTDYSNEYGYTTIEQNQYHDFLNRLDSIEKVEKDNYNRINNIVQYLRTGHN